MTNAQQQVEMVVRTIAETAIENEKYFGDLDAVVGDGDFGYSLARGFEKVLAGWDELDRSDPGTFLKKVGMVVTSRIGGTSGPIWGTAFLRAGMTAGSSPEITGEQAVAMLRAATDGIKMRGQSDVGDKTLLDALVPMTDTIERELAGGKPVSAVLASAATATRQAAEATSEMVAKRGRASYTGDRSRGSVDAGAMAVAVLVEHIAQAWAQQDGQPGAAHPASAQQDAAQQESTPQESTPQESTQQESTQQESTQSESTQTEGVS